MSCPWDIASARQGSRLRCLRPHHGRYVGPIRHVARTRNPDADRPMLRLGAAQFASASVRSPALTADEVSNRNKTAVLEFARCASATGGLPWIRETAGVSHPPSFAGISGLRQRPEIGRAKRGMRARGRPGVSWTQANS